MPTLWNTALQTPNCFEGNNMILRSVGLEKNGGLISDSDINGEDLGRLGRIIGLAEYAGVSAQTVRNWFATPGIRYRRCLILYDIAVPNPGGPPFLYYSLTGRRICNLKAGEVGWSNKYKNLRVRVFLAGMLGGDIQRIPVFTGKKNTTLSPVFPGISDALDWTIQQCFIGVGAGAARRRLSWYKLSMGAVLYDGVKGWQVTVEYNNKRPEDEYTEKVTDCTGADLGYSIEAINQYSEYNL